MTPDRRTTTIPESWVRSLIAGLFVVAGVLVMIGLAVDRAIDRLNGLAGEVQAQAERNTELLTIECDLEAGTAKLVKGKEYVNSPRLLRAHCAKERRRANDIASYIDTIKTGTADQITVSERNILSRLDDLKAAVENRPAPVVVHVPIPRPASRTSAPAPRVGSPAPQKPPAAPPSAKPAPAPAASPQPVTTTTTCPTKGKKPEHCKR